MACPTRSTGFWGQKARTSADQQALRTESARVSTLNRAFIFPMLRMDMLGYLGFTVQNLGVSLPVAICGPRPATHTDFTKQLFA